ncbi:hypothetical protein JCM10914A_39350 [Paenibacillus sp. JCM 10914]|uniref:hypothetical protein n=1 Tax=Paenibacillus sp. JCM 10914 TaxID=1236974 RepID=UPI0003CC3540|nr:hypothetical protein [Paenibacillus sp. JCM 10914]GAE04657.1 hypothetical protein JCM10914_712 [Paenibacillus sp. JCM 10914]
MSFHDTPKLGNGLASIVSKLHQSNVPWLLGGSCSLRLQNVSLDKPPRDIDLYADILDIPLLHQRLITLALDSPYMDQEGMYSSMLSHYEWEGVPIELVGGFEVTSSGSVYVVEIKDLLYQAAPVRQIGPLELRLMPLSHELIFNILRDRPDRYEAIAKAMRQEMNQHSSLLFDMMDRYDLHDLHRILIHRLMGIST